MKINEVYAIAMPEKKRKEERMNIWVKWAVRPLSIVMTAPLVNTKTKPTTITMWSVICCIVGSVLVSININIWINLLGWFFFFSWAVLDGVDGNLARCQGSCSPLGDLWDTMGGYAAMVLIYFSAGVCSYLDCNLIDFLGNYNFLLLIVGGLTAIFSIFPRLVMHKKKSSNVNSKAVQQISDKSKFSISKVFAMNLVSPSGFMQVIFLLCIIFHLLNFFICFYFVVNLGIMIISLRGLLKE